MISCQSMLQCVPTYVRHFLYTTRNSVYKMWILAILKPYFHHEMWDDSRFILTDGYLWLWSFVPKVKSEFTSRLLNSVFSTVFNGYLLLGSTTVEILIQVYAMHDGQALIHPLVLNGGVKYHHYYHVVLSFDAQLI